MLYERNPRTRNVRKDRVIALRFPNNLFRSAAECCALSQLVAASALAAFFCVPVQAEVKLDGVKGDARANVEHALSLAKADCDTSATRLAQLVADTPAQVASALEPLGFYRASVNITDAPADKRNCWRKTVAVTAGEPTRYQSVQVTLLGDGQSDGVFQRVIDSSQPKPGDVVHHGRYKAFKTALQNLATQRGYFNAGFETATVIVSNDAASADATMVFRTGPRFTFGAVDVDSDIVTDELLDTLVDITPGSPYDASDIASTHRNLLDSGYFAFVNVRANPAEAEANVIPVHIDATAAKTRVYTGGLGFATDVGPRFRLNYRNRRINRRGHTLNSELLASPVQSVLGAEYRIPSGEDRRNVDSIAARLIEQNTDSNEFTSIDLGLRRAEARPSGWLRTLGIDLLREDFTVSGIDSSSTLLMPSISYWRSTQAASPRPDKGYRLALDVRGATDSVVSDLSFVQIEATARWIRSFGDRWRLLTRATLGATVLDDIDGLPVSLRFFAGGDNSVRGYEFQGIGPVDADGLVTGGTMLAVGSVEFDYRLNKNWSLAAFVDTGTAFEDGDSDLNTGIGLGVRRMTPVGALRVDLAAPLDRDRKVRLHISIGSDL
ncbi:MAG: autotransporter assembly complex family protein [Pseudomonadota bacterium]